MPERRNDPFAVNTLRLDQSESENASRKQPEEYVFERIQRRCRRLTRDDSNPKMPLIRGRALGEIAAWVSLTAITHNLLRAAAEVVGG